MKIRDLIHDMETLESDNIVITKVTHAQDCNNKKLPKKGNGEWFQIEGNYVYELKDLSYKKATMECGMFKLVPANYTLKKVPITLLHDENFPKLENINFKQKINTFLEKKDLLKSLGVGLIKRGYLVHGPHGGGKTHQINNAVDQCLGENGVSFSFAMSEIDMGQFVEYLSENPPAENVDKLFVVIEDLGGGEQPDLGFRVQSSQDSLLSFLDGNNIPDSWRHLPIIIFSTTNYPMLFLANLIDRPGRFDEVIETKYPEGALLVEYAEKFMKDSLTDFDKREIEKGELSIAHVKDACIKKLVYNEPIHDTIKKMREWTTKVKKSMEKKES